MKSDPLDGKFRVWGRSTKAAIIKWVSKTLQLRLLQIKPKSSTLVLRHSSGSFRRYVGAPARNIFDKASTSCGCRLHKYIAASPQKWTDPKPHGGPGLGRRGRQPRRKNHLQAIFLREDGFRSLMCDVTFIVLGLVRTTRDDRRCYSGYQRAA